MQRLLLSVSLLLSVQDSAAQQWTSGTVPYWRDVNQAVFTEANVLVAVGGRRVNDAIQGIYTSADFGNSFNVISDIPSTTWLRSVHFPSATVGYASGDGGKLLRTADAGVSWETLSSGIPVNLYGIMAPGPTVAYAVGGGGDDDRFILATADGGDSWQTVHQSAGAQLNDVHMTGLLEGVAVGAESTVLITVDGWQTPFAESLPVVTDLYAVTASPDGELFAVGGSEGFSAILRKQGPGSLWEAILYEEGDVLRDIRFLNADTAYATGGETLLISTDGGDTWNPISLPEPEYELELRTIAVAPGPVLFLMGLGGTYHRYSGTDLQPTVQTGAASVTGSGTVQFSGIVFTAGLPGMVSFQYGTDPDLSTFMETSGSPVQSALSVAVSQSVFGLPADQTYYYRCRLQLNSGSVLLGGIMAIEVTENPTVMQLFPASMVNPSGAVLNARVKQLPSPATVSFEVTMPGGAIVEVPGSPSYIDDSGQHDIEGMLSGLSPNTSYPFKLKVTFDDAPQFPMYQGELHVYTGANTIPNPDFEEWEQVEGEKPTEWFNIFMPVSRVTPGHESDNAVRLEITPTDRGAILQGLIGNDLLGFVGIPYSSRPDSVRGRLRYSVVEGDTAMILVGFKSQGQVIAFNVNRFTGASQGEGFELLSFPITYTSSDIPDEMIIAVIPSNMLNEEAPQLSGSWMEIDDIGFNAGHPPVPNGDFEQWTDFSYIRPVQWNFAEHDRMGVYEDPAYQTVGRSSVAQSGNYAVLMRNLAITPSIVLNGGLSTGFSDEDDNASFPINYRPHALNGHFQFHNQGIDTLGVECHLFKNGEVIGSASFQNMDSAAAYGVFTAIVSYMDEETIPDSAAIRFRMHITLGLEAQTSYAIVDNLRFDGFEGDIIVNRSEQINGTPFCAAVHPNPGSAYVNIRLTGFQGESAIVNIFDMVGRQVLPSLALNVSDTQGQMGIETSSLSPGIYIIYISGEFQRTGLRWVKASR